MRYLSIDYGTKRVGLALSDETGAMAFPEAVLPADQKLIPAIKKICSEKSVNLIVLGESKNLNNEPNPLMAKIASFKKKLEEATGLAVTFESEVYSSAAAARLQGDVAGLDASAAAIILQSFLDRQRSELAKVKPKEKISIDEFSKIELSVGKIIAAEKIPETAKLLKLTVEFGEKSPRQIVSGIAEHFPEPAELIGRDFMFVTNLEPRRIRGYESDGMILAAPAEGGGLALIMPSRPTAPGAKAS
jgi:putative transcription antitermination factor YqgF